MSPSTTVSRPSRPFLPSRLRAASALLVPLVVPGLLCACGREGAGAQPSTGSETPSGSKPAARPAAPAGSALAGPAAAARAALAGTGAAGEGGTPAAPVPLPADARAGSREPGLRIATEGKDYVIWQRVRIQDQNGFDRPVEAYSLLLPKGWRTEGGVRWVVNTACPADAVQNRLTAVSPDGEFRLDVFPQHNWRWFDDPMLLQGAQAGGQFGNPACELLRPMDAARYLEEAFVAKDVRGARLVSHEPSEELGKMMREQAEAANASYRAAGVRIESRPSAEVGRVAWRDGRIGIALCAVEQTVSAMPNLLDGNTYASYQCRATVKTVLAAPAGREEEARRLLATIVASTRVNPDWQAAVQRVFTNIAQVEMRETAKRAAMWRETQREIGEMQRRTWEASQESRDRISEAWGQTLRGVETWNEPGGAGGVELSAGYREAWSKGDGTYILSNDPLFDPSVTFQEDWKRLEKR